MNLRVWFACCLGLMLLGGCGGKVDKETYEKNKNNDRPQPAQKK